HASPQRKGKFRGAEKKGMFTDAASSVLNAPVASQDVPRATFKHWRPSDPLPASRSARMASERSDVVASRQPVCAVCGGTAEARTGPGRAQPAAAQKEALRARDDEIRALLVTALRKLEEGAP